MDILFITPTHKPGLSQEINGTMLLATKLLQAGFTTDILRFYQVDGFDSDYPRFIDNITQKILQMAPRFLSFYSLWPSFHIILRIVQRIKQIAPHIPVILGGPLVSLYPETVMNSCPWVDYLCAGEGENTIVPFMNALTGKQSIESVPGLYYRKDGVLVHNEHPIPLCNLNTLPNWDCSLFASDPRLEDRITDKKYFMPIDVGRGCPFNCTFCCTSHFWSHTYRLKSAEKIVDELKYYRNNFNIRSFLFSHDAFTVKKNLVSEVCDRILEEKLDINWCCTTRADCVTEELLLKMKDAGLSYIQLGVETGSERMQQQINKRLDLNVVKNVVHFLLKNKIDLLLFFMYGFPEETEDDLRKTLDLIFYFYDIGVRHITMSFLNFSPATQITLDYYDQLVFDPNLAVSARCDFGYEEEMEIIQANKDLFPFFYHLNTPLRNSYLFLTCLTAAYEALPKEAKIIRSLYNGDDLAFYRDFVRNNPDCFDQYLNHAMDCVKKKPMVMLYNTIRELDHPCITQIRSLLEFRKDCRKVKASKEDIRLQKTYNFSYLDYHRGCPLDQYTSAQTELVMIKRDGKFSISLISIHE